jgi:flagellar basal-body rod modification protein FlgD
MSTVGALAGSSASSTSGVSGFSAMSSADFSKIIFTELSKQDPLQPNDTNALLQQISALRSIQSNMDLSTQLGDLVSQNEFASSMSLIGRAVSGLDDSGSRVQGTVKSISRTSDGAVATFADGTRVSVKNLDQVDSGGTP